MSQLNNQQSSFRPRKRYKLYNEDSGVPVPLRTLYRWEKLSSFHDHATRNANNSSSDTDMNIITVDVSDIDTSEENSPSEISDNDCITNEDSENENAEDEQADESIQLESDHFIDESDVEDYYEPGHTFDSGNNDNYQDQHHEVLLNENLASKYVQDRNNHQSVMLYENCSVSVDQAVFDLPNYYVKHKISKAALKEALRIQIKILPENNAMPKTVHKLFQYAKKLAPPCIAMKHYFCKTCSGYISSDIKVINCPTCNEKVDKDYFFFEFDIHSQIKYLFENYDLSGKLKPLMPRNENVIADITDGSEYVRVNLRPNRHKYDLTLIINTDGLSLIKSAKSHCWPLLGTIAELPANLRESFIINLGLWYSKECKPCMNTFLRPLYSKLNQCFEEGIRWIHPVTKASVTSKVVAPLIIADAPARAKLQNISNFNGRYGCNICEIRTKKSQNAIHGTKRGRFYPYNLNARLRDGDRMINLARKLRTLEKEHLRGVKGYSILSCISLLDLGTCFIPEFMHSVLLGVVKRFFNIHINKPGPWSVKPFIGDIDKFITNIRPPLSFNRMPRSLTQCHFFKATEFFNLLLFYSLPALENYLQVQYFQHLMTLVIAIFNLVKDQITVEDLEQADKLLKVFVGEIPDKFGDKELTYNSHQLLHLVLSVKRWGPPSATSAFCFENYNGFIAKSVSGTKHLSQEIVNNVMIAQSVGILKNHVITQYRNLDPELGKNHDQLLGKRINNIRLSDSERELFVSEGIDLTNVFVYARAKIRNEIYTSNI